MDIWRAWIYWRMKIETGFGMVWCGSSSCDHQIIVPTTFSCGDSGLHLHSSTRQQVPCIHSRPSHKKGLHMKLSPKRIHTTGKKQEIRQLSYQDSVWNQYRLPGFLWGGRCTQY